MNEPPTDQHSEAGPAALPPEAVVTAAPPPSTSAAPGKDSDAAGIDVRIQQLSAEQTEIANTINRYDHCSIFADMIPVEELAARHFNPCRGTELDRLLTVAVFDENELRQIELQLQRHRVIVIAGESDVGKGTLALLAAARLRHQDHPPHPVAETSPLSPEIRAPLLQLAGHAGKLGAGIWLFRDFLATDHRDLTRFVEELDGFRLGSLAERLTTAGAYLLFTSDSAKLRGMLPRLDALGIAHCTSGPAPVHARLVLARKADELARPPKVDEGLRQRIRELVDTEGDHIVQALRTPPRIARFVERFLLTVAVGDGSLEQAIERFDDLTDWLLKGLAGDLETWSFAIALVLAQPRPPYLGSPWLEVHELARSVARYLRVVLRQPRAAGIIIADESRLDRLNAEMRRFHHPGADMVRFRDGSYPERLWQVLLGPGRELLSLLLPLLRRLCEDSDSSRFSLRFVAARALGRCGEMDARAIAFPAISSWSRSSREIHHVALGHLLQGALGSRVDGFREACLGQLRQAIEGSSGGKAWAPAVALREIGSVDLPLAVDGLISLVDRNLDEPGLRIEGPVREALQKVEEKLCDKVVRPGSRGAAPRTLEEELRKLLTPALCRFERAPQEALAAVQYAFVGLCFAHGPLGVLSELSQRLAARDERRLVPLLPLLTLRQGGIVDILERFPLPVASETSLSSPSTVASRFLIFAGLEYQGARDLIELLTICYDQCDFFPGSFARALRSRLLDLLKDWARQSARQPDLRPTGRLLLAGLLRCRLAGLKERIFFLLHDDREFSDPESPLNSLAREVLTAHP